MSAVLFDMGNSRIKWAHVDVGSALTVGEAIAYDDNDWLERLREILARLPAPERVLLASVTHDEREHAVQAVFRDVWNCTVRVIASETELAGVKNAYPVPTNLGVDRLLAMVAAHHRYPGPACIVDCGTAITLDALAANGQHLGGLISTSPAMACAALRTAAPALDGRVPGSLSFFASDTPEAVANGAMLSAQALIARFIAASRREFGVPPRVLLTGGGMQTLRAGLESTYLWVPNLVLEGMAVLLVNR